MNFETGERLKTIIGVSYIPGGLLDYPYGYFSNTTYSKDENTIHLTLGYDLVEWNWQNADDAEKYLPAPAIK
ncbi:MAG: hypothetical protein NT027_05200 [Proteobacteria bacterium]|nr:hypothetical protein [Pseudomonadota bacterium]